MNLAHSSIAFMMILSAAPVSIAQTTILTPDTSKTVSVTGHGSVSTVPDTASADVGVSVVDSDARKAKAAVDATVAKILSVAKGLGVAEVDLRTAAVNIEPRYDEKDRTRLRGYEVTQSVTATIHDLSKLDSFLDGAVQAGANRDFNVTLSSSREAALKQQALKLAIDAAKEQADAAARQLNVRLGAVRSINLNTGNYGQASLASRVSVSDSSRFLPGTITIDANVGVVFLIEDR